MVWGVTAVVQHHRGIFLSYIAHDQAKLTIIMYHEMQIVDGFIIIIIISSSSSAAAAVAAAITTTTRTATTTSTINKST